MKTTLAAIIAAALLLTGCGLNRAFPVGPNPLDEPGEEQPTAEQLHVGNLRAITNNPTL